VSACAARPPPLTALDLGSGTHTRPPRAFAVSTGYTPCLPQRDGLEHLGDEVDRYLTGQKRPSSLEGGPPGKRSQGYQSPTTTLDELIKDVYGRLNPDHYVTPGEFTGAIIDELPLEEITAADEVAVRQFVSECGIEFPVDSSGDDSGDDSGDGSGDDSGDAEAPAAPASNHGSATVTIDSSSESELDHSEPAKPPRATKKRKKNPKPPCHAQASKVLADRHRDVKAAVERAPVDTWVDVEPTANPERACLQKQRTVSVIVCDPHGKGKAVVLETLRKSSGTKGMPEKQFSAIEKSANNPGQQTADPDDMPTTPQMCETGNCVLVTNGPIHSVPNRRSYFGKNNPPMVYVATSGKATLKASPSGGRAFTMADQKTQMYNTGTKLKADREAPLRHIDGMVLEMVQCVAKEVGWSNVRIVINNGQSQSDKDTVEAITKSLRALLSRIEAHHDTLREMNYVPGRPMPEAWHGVITAILPMVVPLAFVTHKGDSDDEAWRTVETVLELLEQSEYAPTVYTDSHQLLESSAKEPEKVIDDIGWSIECLVIETEDPLSNLSPSVSAVIGKLAMILWGFQSESQLDRQQTLYACKLVLWKWYDSNELQRTRKQLAICTEAIEQMRALTANGEIQGEQIDLILKEVSEAAPVPALDQNLPVDAAQEDLDMETKLIDALRASQYSAKQVLIDLLKGAGQITEADGVLNYEPTMPGPAREFADATMDGDPEEWPEPINVFIRTVVEKAGVTKYADAATDKIKEGFNRPVGAVFSTVFATAAGEIIQDAKKHAAEIEKKQDAIKQALEKKAASALARRPKRSRRPPKRLIAQEDPPHAKRPCTGGPTDQ
jgi:hypothetical protein